MREPRGDKTRLSEYSEEPLLSREISPEEALMHFPHALRELRSQLAKRTHHYNDVTLRSLARQIGWWVDGDGDLIGKGQHLGMLSPGWKPGDMDEVVMLWDKSSKRWVETSATLGEVHIDNPGERMGSFGGAEPTPDYAMTVEEVRTIVRQVLKGSK